MSPYRSKSRTTDWSALPPELLHAISTRFVDPVDIAVFRAVCTSWRSGAARFPGAARLPWLLLAPYELSAGAADFFSLTRGRSHRLLLPEARGKLCLGASRGWLVLQSDNSAISLLNPFTRAQLHLPPFPSFLVTVSSRYTLESGVVVKKAVLSSDPSAADCALLLVLQSDTLAVCRVAGHSWTFNHGIQQRLGAVSDVAYLDGRFYTVAHDGRLGSFDADGRSEQVFPLIRNTHAKIFKHLVESSGELLLVTDEFEVFSIDFSVRPPRAVQAERMEDRMVFVGPNHSFSLPAGDNCGPFAGNSIYFVRTYRLEGFLGDVGCRIGRFSLEDGSRPILLPLDLGKLFLTKPNSQWITVGVK